MSEQESTNRVGVVEPIDFAAVGNKAIGAAPIGTGHAKAFLAAKVTERCPDCKGTGTRRADVSEMSGQAMNDGGYACSEFFAPCPHPNAPTIGRMLAEWQPLMALAEYAWHRPDCPMFHPSRHQNCTCGLNAALAALQEVRHG